MRHLPQIDEESLVGMIDDKLPEVEENEDEKDENKAEDNSEPLYYPKDIDIVTEQNSLLTIIEMLDFEDISLKPEFQRELYLWSGEMMSRLIESILMRVPLPAFYFDASDDYKWRVIDGFQRLSTFKKFIIDKQLVLKGLNILTHLNGKTYDELDSALKTRIARYQITTHVIKPGTHKKVTADIFRRVNTGGLRLTDQEIRHALSEGKVSGYLKKLVASKPFTQNVHVSDDRMQAHEFVLRYLAFSMTHYREYNAKNFTIFLDEAMDKVNVQSDEYLDELENNLWKALAVCQKLFDEYMFTRLIIDAKQIKTDKIQQNGALFEVWTVLIAALNEHQIKKLLSAKSQVIKAFKSTLKSDKEFYESLSGFKNKNYIIKRFTTVEALINKYTI